MNKRELSSGVAWGLLGGFVFIAGFVVLVGVTVAAAWFLLSAPH